MAETGSFLPVVAVKEKLPWPRGFTINAQLKLCISFCYSVAAERNSELSVSAGVGVVLWLLFCLFFGLIYINFSLFKCARLGWNNFL